MALTDKQRTAVQRMWGVGLGQTARVPDKIPTEHRTLMAEALRLAAAQYRIDATTSANTPRVADQFTLQADLCEEIAGMLEL